MILIGKEFDTISDNPAESIAIIIFNPSNSMGKVRITKPVEIASKRFLNLISPFFIMPNILVRESEIVVTDQITSTQESAIPKEKIAEASYLTSRPSGLPDASDSSNKVGRARYHIREMMIGMIAVERTSTDISQFRSGKYSPGLANE